MDDLQEWPQYATGPRDSLFAIGVASSNFAALEAVLHFIFGTVFDLGQDDYAMIASKIGTEATLILTRQKVDSLDCEQDIKDSSPTFSARFSDLPRKSQPTSTLRNFVADGYTQNRENVSFQKNKKGRAARGSAETASTTGNRRHDACVQAIWRQTRKLD
jgi:hypothetical protein